MWIAMGPADVPTNEARERRANLLFHYTPAPKERNENFLHRSLLCEGGSDPSFSS
jgi:hypothetical protein